MSAGRELDGRAVVAGYARAALTYDAAAVLEREIARRMAERLQYVRLDPQRVLDLGAGTGADLAVVRQAYPDARLVAADLSLPMLQRAQARSPRGLAALFERRPAQLACCDARALPFAAGSFGLAWSNQMLHWLADPRPAFAELHRVLQVDGLLMFSTLGPDTLKELRSALGTAATSRMHEFLDMHDIGDMLVGSGFADPVMDMETITLTYADLSGLLADLRASGAANRGVARPRGLTGRGWWQAVRRAYEGFRREGRLPATFEVVYGHAWKAAPRQAADGRAIVQFQRRRPLR